MKEEETSCQAKNAEKENEVKDIEKRIKKNQPCRRKEEKSKSEKRSRKE